MVVRRMADGSTAMADARALVERHGHDTLSFFKLRGDIERLFSRDGRAMLGYAIVGSVLLVAGDAIGPAESVGALVGEALRLASERGLRLGVLGASEGGRVAFEAAGLHPTYIGDEAIVHTRDFSLRGGPMRRLRKPMARFPRMGFAVEWRRLGELAPEVLAELEELAALGRHGRRERSFAWAMDGLRGTHQERSLVVVARDGSGAARAFLHLVPAADGTALSVSMMRRDPGAPNGIMDFLVVSAIERARGEGVELISLNFAAFSRWLREPAGPRERLGGRLVRLGSRVIQMESLYRFNAKFRPRWEPRYLLHEGRFGLVRTGVAAMRVEGQLELALWRAL
jgi:lysyl-tRNA synthetase class 2